MHPHPAFRWQDEPAMRAFVAAAGFGALFVATPDGPRVAHVPIVFDGDDLLFHVSRGNAVTRHLAGATGLFSVQGPDAYVSPDWYGTGPDEVPTWNYIAVEVEGTLSTLDRAGLLDLLDRLSEENEAALAPKPGWTRAKADPRKIDRMIDAIAGFRLTPQVWRGTAKLAQTKPEAARLAVADALEAQGRRAIAHWMRHLPEQRP